MSLSFLRYAVTGFSLALYQHRTPLDCPDPFCLYTDPKLIIRDIGMQGQEYGMYGMQEEDTYVVRKAVSSIKWPHRQTWLLEFRYLYQGNGKSKFYSIKIQM